VRRHPEKGSLDEVELRAREWKRVLGAAKASGLAVVVEPLDLPSLELAAEAEVDGFQVHGTDMENPEFIRAVGARGRPVLLAVGGVPEPAVRDATGLLGGAPAGLVHGFPSSPAPPEELSFRDIDGWKERYRVPVGFLDLTDGGSAFALVAPAVSAAHGADFVEKHFTLDRTRKGPDYPSSLSPEDFYRMVELLRQAERAEGEGARGENEGAFRTRRLLARSIVAGALIPRGEVLTAPMLAFKRTDTRYEPGYPPKEAHRVIGRRAARPIQADETIREDMLE
jgi:N,N'-diacetyllegionaminate synthase